MGKPLSGNAIQLTLLNIYTIHSTRYPLVKHQCNIKSQQLNHQSAAKSARPNKIHHRRLRSSTMLQTMLQCSKLTKVIPENKQWRQKTGQGGDLTALQKCISSCIKCRFIRGNVLTKLFNPIETGNVLIEISRFRHIRSFMHIIIVHNK